MNTYNCYIFCHLKINTKAWKTKNIADLNPTVLYLKLILLITHQQEVTPFEKQFCAAVDEQDLSGQVFEP